MVALIMLERWLFDRIRKVELDVRARLDGLCADSSGERREILAWRGIGGILCWARARHDESVREIEDLVRVGKGSL